MLHPSAHTFFMCAHTPNTQCAAAPVEGGYLRDRLLGRECGFVSLEGRGGPVQSVHVHGGGCGASCCAVLGYKGYKDGLQPETLADGNWLVKHNQPVSKIETKSDTNLRSLYES